MSRQEVTDEMLMALADGELDAVSAEGLRARLARDPALRARYERFARSSEAVRALFAPVLAETPPAALSDAVRRAANAPPAAKPFGHGRALAIAATVACIGLIGFAFGAFRSADPGVDALSDFRRAAHSLEDRLTGEVVDLPDGARAVVMASFATAAGPCRQFQLRDGEGGVWESLGCLEGGQWRIALVLPQPADEDYLPAEGASAVSAYLDAAGGATPLAAEAEAAQVEAGWGLRAGG